MSAPTTDELLERIERLQAQVETLGARGTSSRRRGVRLALGIVTLATLLAVPIGVFASHQFTDVPNSNTFHAQIGRVKGAGITSGCSATKYCPDNPVTRGQMAAFLARTGGRLAASPFEATNVALSNTGATPTVLATVSIKAGDVPGGYASVQLSGAFTTYANAATGLPSIVASWVRDAATGAKVSNFGYAQVDQITDAVAGVDTAAIVGAASVPTGVSKTYELVAYRQYGTGAMRGFATLNATYIPFKGDGTNFAAAAAPAAEPEDVLTP
jgi:hypothetical protein